MRFVFLLVAATGFAAATTTSAVLADDIYVNNVRGDDKFNGRLATDATASAGPVKTIARALQIANRGDRIIVEKTDQPYYESLSVQGVRHSGTDVMPFTIFSNGAILDGTSPVDPQAWEYVGDRVFRFQPPLKSFQQLYLDGKPAERVIPDPRTTVPELQSTQWALVDGWIYFRTESQSIPGQYDLRYCRHQTGITLYEVNNVVIDGLTIQGFQLDGVNAHDAVGKTVVRNCRLRGNGRSGYSVGGASQTSLNSSVIGANGDSQVRTEGFSRLAIRDCRLLESPTTGPAIDQAGGKITVDGRDLKEAISMLRRKP